jgi:argininosuccinate lyase
MPFSPDYVRIVLNENFEDAKTLFLEPLMSIHYAHLVMLHDTGIVSTADARAIKRALDGINLDAVRQTVYDGSCEDLFFYLERQIVNACGEAVAGRLHTARSRNDIDMAMYRMRIREFVLALVQATVRLRQSLIELADRHRHTVFPAHTHTQPAQPSTVAHYLLAVIEQLERDTVRLKASYASVNVSPLGACAITGTGFPIDRDRTGALLGFDGTTGNTYGSIATVDYLLEAAAAAGVTLAGTGRFVQDLLLWCTMEVGYLRLTDAFVQVSSIMPQKRNPVALEHARALSSKAFAQAGAIPVAVHNTPFGDIVDTEDDLQPLVAAMFKDAVRAVSLVAFALEGAEFDVAKMRQRATENWISVTELADTLVRDHGLSFKAGHTIAARLVRTSQLHPDAAPARLVAEISKEVTGTAIEYSDAELETLLSPEHFVAVRRTHGGPAPEITEAAIAASRALFSEDSAWISGTKSRLLGAESALKAASFAMG